MNYPIRENKTMKKSKATKGEAFNTPAGRFVYSSLVERDSKYGKNDHRVTLLVPKSERNDKLVGDIFKQLNELAQESLGKKHFHIPIQDGDEQDRAIYAGNWVIRAHTGYDIKLYDKDDMLVSGPDARELFYDGAWGKINVTPSVYSSGTNHGVTLYLNGAKFLQHDKKIGGGKGFNWGDDEEDELPMTLEGLADEL